VIKFSAHLQTYIYSREYQDTYDYIVDIFKKMGIEQIKDLKQKKTLITQNGIQIIEEKIQSNILVFKCMYLLENMIAYCMYGGKIIIELEILNNNNTKVIVYGKEDPHSPSLGQNEKLYDLDVILSKLKPPKIKPNK